MGLEHGILSGLGLTLALTLPLSRYGFSLTHARRAHTPGSDGRAQLEEACFNETAVEMLHKLPGITERNYRSVLSRCECLADLATMSQADIQVRSRLPQKSEIRHGSQTPLRLRERTERVHHDHAYPR